MMGRNTPESLHAGEGRHLQGSPDAPALRRKRANLPQHMHARLQQAAPPAPGSAPALPAQRMQGH